MLDFRSVYAQLKSWEWLHGIGPSRGSRQVNNPELEEHAQDVFAEPGFADLAARDGIKADAQPLGKPTGAAARTRAESDAAWHHLTISTDRDGATAADCGPLAAADR